MSFCLRASWFHPPSESVAVYQFSALKEGRQSSGLRRQAALTGHRLPKDFREDPADHYVDIWEAGGHDVEALHEAFLAHLLEDALRSLGLGPSSVALDVDEQ